jgi:hypothetical protein
MQQLTPVTKRCDRKPWSREDAERWASERSAKWAGTSEREEYAAEHCAQCGVWHVRRAVADRTRSQSPPPPQAS